MKATIEKDGCIGCGLCCELCPKLFRMADDGVAEVIEGCHLENIDSAHEAEESCPVSVISITDLE